MFSNDLKIADHLAYRYYGKELLIVMDWKTKQTYILRNVAAKVWNQFDSKKSQDDINYFENSQLIEKLMRTGLLVFNGKDKQNNFTYKPNSVITFDEDVTHQAIDQWAARNNIPINGSFSVTGQCNLRCSHCYSVHQDSHFLSTDQVLRILDDLKLNGNIALTLTGGEFFTRPDYKDILSNMCKNKFAIKINSNGTRINEAVVKDIADCPQLSHIHISLYSAIPDVHDGITGVKGSFYQTMHALKLLKETDKIIRINCCVMKSNASSYKSVKQQIGDQYGIPVRYDSRLVPKNNGEKTNLKERAADRQIEDFYKWLLDVGLLDEQNFMFPKRQQSSNQIGLCSAGLSYFEVSEYGELYPCFQLRMPLGSLLQSNFDSLWNHSSFLHQLRNSTQDTLFDCKDCQMKAICNLCIGMSHLEDGKIFGKSLECCRDTRIRYKIGTKLGLINSQEDIDDKIV